jgi:hypothetical protein
VLDMACGSGSFLLGAYRSLLDYCLNWYTEHKPETFKRAVYKDPRNGQWRLTIEEKKRILTTHFFGVDIDPQAVEVTKLSLLLKVLEGETDQSFSLSQLAFGERALPNLADNIKCGNSLVGSDYFTGKMFPDPEEVRHVNPFDWRQGFPDAIKAGGFDCIIGNPPYNALLSEGEVVYLRERIESVRTGRADTAAMFVEQSKKLNAKQVAMLVPYRLLSRKRNHGGFQRWLVSRNSIEQVIYLGCVKEIGANDEFMICVFRPGSAGSNNVAIGLDVSRGQLESGSFRLYSVAQREWGPPDFTINIRSFQFSQPLLIKIRECSIPLGDIAESKDGIVPHIREKLISEKALDKRYKPFVGVAGTYDLRRYHLSRKKRFICYDIEEAKKWIKDKSELRKVQLRDERIFLQSRKILTAQDSATLKGTIDHQRLYHSNSMHSTYLKPTTIGYRLEYVLGLLNSKLINYYHSSLVLKGTDLHPQVLVTNLPKLPVRCINFSKPTEKAAHDRMVNLVDSMLGLHRQLRKAKSAAQKSVMQRQIEATDRAIDRLVYDLYCLTAEEIALIEAQENSRSDDKNRHHKRAHES